MEHAIVAALRQAGVIVLPLSGPGVPDLLCYHRNRWLPLEVKSTANDALTGSQAQLWLATHFPVVRSVEDALRAFGLS